MAIFAPPEPTTTASTRSLVGLTDCELVAEVRRGCDRAFEQLYERYHRRIAAYIYGMVNDYGRAEDIAQDVFMSALRRMRDTDRAIAFKPWVYEIAKNACIDQFRRARRSEEVSYDAEEGLGAADYGRLVTTGPAPDVAVDQKMAIDHLCGAFGGLSQTHHEILVMRELEGLSYREIGERLGMSRPSVESTLFRARRRLGEEYEELVSGERCVRIQGIIAAAGAAVPGARDQRRMAAHLSHCQPCRRHARVAGLDAAVLATPRAARARIAALIPLPAFLRRRWFGEEVAPVASQHHATLAQFSAQLGTSVDPAIASWAKAAAAAATLAVAGVAGGAAVSDETRTLGQPGRSAAAPPVAKAPAAKPAKAPAAAPTVALQPGAPASSVGSAPAAGAPTVVAGAGAPAAQPAPASGAPGPASPASPLAPPVASPGAPAAPQGLPPFEPAGPQGSAGAKEEPLTAPLRRTEATLAESATAADQGSAATKGQLEGAVSSAAEGAATVGAGAVTGG